MILISIKSKHIFAVRRTDMSKNTSNEAFRYGIDTLNLDRIMRLATGQLEGVLDAAGRAQIERCRNYVLQMAASQRAVYGLNTGFGPLCDVRISAEETGKLQENLLLTHAVGVGDYIDPLYSKIMMICKVHALAQGYSGVRTELVDRIMYFIRHDLLPAVPEQGSVGASGDLAPLSHLFLPFLGEGAFWVDGRVIEAKEVLREHDLQPLSFRAKEGLALINGTQFILAHAIVGLHRMKYLIQLADLAGAMTLEGYQGSSSPFREALHRIRPFEGNVEVARHMSALLEGSENNASHASCSRVQDPYSIRCIPQVHGAVRAAWKHLLKLAEIEMNAVTDNPVILNEAESISGGNFHGQPLAFALDYATLAASGLGNISDRRCYLLLEGKFGLPRLLTDKGGLNSGYMIPQYTTAALASENKTMCFPASADSIPTSLGQEDFVSMGSIAGRKFNRVLENVEKILAIELLYAAQAIEFRRPLRCSEVVEENMRRIRARVPKLEEDRLLKDDIQTMIEMVKSRSFETG